jgi:hypothetical protein
MEGLQMGSEGNFDVLLKRKCLFDKALELDSNLFKNKNHAITQACYFGKTEINKVNFTANFNKCKSFTI